MNLTFLPYCLYQMVHRKLLSGLLVILSLFCRSIVTVSVSLDVSSFSNSRCLLAASWGWSGGAMVLGKLPVPGRPTIWIIVGQGPIALAVGAGGGCLDIFTLICPFSPLSPSRWETARYRLKYCLKGLLNPKQPTNQLAASYVTENSSSNFSISTTTFLP